VAPLNESSSITLSNDEILRYSRHLIMPEVTMEGQKKLKAARVLCVGTGGLGSPLALYLTAAGVGTLGLVDFDVVDYTNLQRQVLHYTSDVGRLKIDSAIDKLTAINPFVKLERFDTYLNSQNALEIFRGFDISPMAPITSPRATWSTMPACSAANPTSTLPSSASRARPASSAPRMAVLSLPLS